MDQNIRNWLTVSIAVLLVVGATGSFFLRYAGFTKMIDHMDSVALSDDIVKENEESGLQLSDKPMSSDSEILGSGSYKLSYSNQDSRLSENYNTNTNDSGLTTGLLIATKEGLTRLCSGGELLGILIPSAMDGIYDDSIVIDGVTSSGVNLEDIDQTATYRVVYQMNEFGVVTNSLYEKIDN